MPLHHLSVTPVDVRGSELGLALNGPAPHPLVSVHVDHPTAGVLTLGVLGASHVVTVDHADGRFREQVSCDLAGDLPDQTFAPGFRLESSNRLLGPVEFRHLAQRLRDRCTAEKGWLGGAFPGDDAAVTVLAAEAHHSGWRWRTWHLYPTTTGGTVVATSSRWRP